MTASEGSVQDHPRLIQALLEPAAYGAKVERVELIETHISWVLLTGEFAYKIKKPINLGFLDFSTLEKRLHACREELRLNRRTAADLYLEVVAITGSVRNPRLLGIGALPSRARVLEYAVKMREFPQTAQLDRRLRAGALGMAEMDAIGAGVAAFHAAVATAGPATPWGEPEAVKRFVDENFSHQLASDGGTEVSEQLARLRAWSDRQFDELKGVLAGRKADGFVRECHGDLHLTNLAALEDGITAFDCIEFNPELRWIDVISEVAFLMMDLQSRDHDELAYRFTNAYLESSGDYESLTLLRYYLVYRSLVRAKVAAIRISQGRLSVVESAAETARYRKHVALASRTSRAPGPRLVITCGLSGSGKTWVSDRLLTRLPALRIRADLERKRLFGLDPLQDSGSGIDSGIYSESATRQTYARLAELARIGVQAGFSIILDGAFLKLDQRRAVARMAEELKVALVILECQAETRILEERIRRRSQAGSDASEADLGVLAHQRAHAEPLERRERAIAVRIDTGKEIDFERLCARVRAN